ncbi:MAG: hypothetical protein AB7V13_04050 [Pseudorhodoplanes sp.]|uniref:hypothetical protein n=1 Tax=Pseudorhodoplanes sp. TaxID=1934341 RepID=UPI003D0E769D
MKEALPPLEVMAELATAMDAILHLIEQETALVRAGRLSDAARLQAEKTELANLYYAGASHIRTILPDLASTHPQALAAMKRKHEEFRALLQTNLTVLATAHAVSEGIMRGVSDELARKAAPSTYGATGRTNAPRASAAQPLAVSRVL